MPSLFTATARHQPVHLVDCTMFWSATGGGVRRYLLAKHAWLQFTDWRHTIVAPGAQGPGFADCGGLPLPLSGGYRLPLRRELAASILEKQAPDLIEVGDPYRLAWAALDAAHRLDVPAVTFCHSNLAALAARVVGGQGARARWARRTAGAYLGRTYRQFDLVLAPSWAMVHELQELGVANAAHQPLGVDTSVFHPGRHDPRLRRALGLPADCRLLLYAGRFAPEKNLQLLAETVRHLGPRYVLLAVGAGSYPPLGSQVMLLPHQSRDGDLARLFASVDAFVHAGDQETFGLAALEAMACGTPVVVRNAAGLAELVAGDCGIGVNSSRIGEWAEAIAEIFTSEREIRSVASRHRAEAYDWNKVMPLLFRSYRRLLGDDLDEAGEGGAIPALLREPLPTREGDFQ
ncbi:MAG: glycosyltransferase [Betaproteobacteria bacterium]